MVVANIKRNLLYMSLSLLSILIILGCAEQGTIKLVTITPSEEPDLLINLDVQRLQILIKPISENSENSIIETILHSKEQLNIQNLDAGKWIIEIHGFNKLNTEVAQGTSLPFDVTPGKSGNVHVFIGRTFDFNLVDLTPKAIADQLTGLQNSSATQFKNSNNDEMILISGGHNLIELGDPTTAFLINPANFTIETIENKMPCALDNHFSFAVNTKERGEVVVLAGGNSSCDLGLTVYFPDTKEFSFIPVSKNNGCDVFATDGAVPELLQTTDGSNIHSGKVIIPGDTFCVIDPLGIKPDTSWTRTAFENSNSIATAVNDEGWLVAIDSLGNVFVDTAYARDSSGDICSAKSSNIATTSNSLNLSGLQSRAKLIDIGNQSFVFIGKHDTDKLKSNSDFAIIDIAECQMQTSVKSISNPNIDIADFETISIKEKVDKSVLVINNDNVSYLKKVIIKSKDSQTSKSIPVWFNKIPNFPLSMKSSRDHHTTAETSNNAVWILGGGNTPAEIFIKSETPLNITASQLEARNPILTSMMVQDTTVKMVPIDHSLEIDFKAVNNAWFTEKISKNVAGVVSLYGTSDIGIGYDDLNVDTDFINNQNIYGASIDCNQGITAFEQINAKGIIFGDITKETYDINMNGLSPFDNGQGKDAAQYIQLIISDLSPSLNSNTPLAFHSTTHQKAYVSSADYPTDSSSNSRLSNNQPVKNNDEIIFETQEGCNWRQSVRVGFDGLNRGTTDGTYGGIHALIWVTNNDDCSQAIDRDEFFDLGVPIEDFEKYNCQNSTLETYFTDWMTSMDSIVEQLTWDQKDLIILLVRNAKNTKMCGGELENLSAPRRLMKIRKLMNDRNVIFEEPIDLCDPSDTTIIAEKLATFVEKRNRLQTCVPNNIITQPILVDTSVGPATAGGLIVPLNQNGLETHIQGEQVNSTLNVKNNCQIIAWSQDQSCLNCATTNSLPYGYKTGWSIGVDTDRSANCDEGWTVTVQQNEQTKDNKYILVCM